MQATSQPLLISAPFGMPLQIINTPRYHWDNHSRGDDSFVILQLTLQGAGIFELGGTPHPVPEDHLFIALVPEASVYYYPREATEPWHCAWVNFYGPLGVSLLRQLREAFGPVLPLPRRTAARAHFTHLTETTQPRTPVHDPYERSAAAYTFLMEWTRELALPHTGLNATDPVQTALALCRARYREPLGVKELAAAVGLTREHFSRLFAERTGTTPARHLRELRVAMAREMMQNPGTLLTEVALRCGFPSVRALRRALASVVSQK